MSEISLIVTVVGVVGLVVGSFLNVVIYRVPAKLSIVTPRSACQRCGTKIRPLDNVPVLSWLVLRGRCRACQTPISARYPLVEILTATLFVGVAFRFGSSWTLPAELLFVAGLIALAFCDYDHMILPKRIVWSTTLLVSAALIAAAGALGEWRRLGVVVACGAAEFLLFFALNMANPRWLGFGDVRLAPLLGGALGWIGPQTAIVGLFLGNLTGVVIGLGLIAFRRSSRQARLPFGVFLAIGAVIALLVSPTVFDGIFRR
jgi:leader peptidase (prepilin peptidase)/N-methyltransferase